MEDLKTQPIIPLKLLSGTYKMLIPANVERKIQYLLNRIYNIEWSGILFYTYTGSFEDRNLVVECKDILPMDIGGATSTEFDMSPDVVAYMTENDLLDCQMGLVHSHHSMATFFSGTDTNTLLEEGKDRNNFVSLIVNNAGTYNAAITRRVRSTKYIEDHYSYEFFDKGVKEETRDYTKYDEEVQYFYLNVEKEGGDTVFKELHNRLEEIRKAKDLENKSVNVYSSGKPFYRENPANNTFVRQPSLFDDINYANPLSGNASKKEPYDIPDAHFDKKTIYSVAAQIVTGCVTINEEKLASLKKVNMYSIYKRRFGDATIEFDSFADYLLEFLLWHTTSDRLLKIYDADTLTLILARDILEELDKLPENIFLKVFKEKLNNWIIL